MKININKKVEPIVTKRKFPLLVSTGGAIYMVVRKEDDSEKLVLISLSGEDDFIGTCFYKSDARDLAWFDLLVETGQYRILDAELNIEL